MAIRARLDSLVSRQPQITEVGIAALLARAQRRIEESYAAQKREYEEECLLWPIARDILRDSEGMWAPSGERFDPANPLPNLDLDYLPSPRGPVGSPHADGTLPIPVCVLRAYKELGRWDGQTQPIITRMVIAARESGRHHERPPFAAPSRSNIATSLLMLGREWLERATTDFSKAELRELFVLCRLRVDVNFDEGRDRLGLRPGELYLSPGERHSDLFDRLWAADPDEWWNRLKEVLTLLESETSPKAMPATARPGIETGAVVIEPQAAASVRTALHDLLECGGDLLGAWRDARMFTPPHSEQVYEIRPDLRELVEGARPHLEEWVAMFQKTAATAKAAIGAAPWMDARVILDVEDLAELASDADTMLGRRAEAMFTEFENGLKVVKRRLREFELAQPLRPIDADKLSIVTPDAGARLIDVQRRVRERARRDPAFAEEIRTAFTAFSTLYDDPAFAEAVNPVPKPFRSVEPEPPDPYALGWRELQRLPEADRRTIMLHRLGGLADLGCFDGDLIVPEPVPCASGPGDWEGLAHDAPAMAVWRARLPAAWDDHNTPAPAPDPTRFPPDLAEQMLEAVAPAGPPAGAEAGENAPVIDESDVALLQFLARRPNLRRRVSDVLPEDGPQDRKAIGKRLTRLAGLKPPLVDKNSRGVAITAAGLESLQQASAAPA